mgnify:CR=1 FL=1
MNNFYLGGKDCYPLCFDVAATTRRKDSSERHIVSPEGSAGLLPSVDDRIYFFCKRIFLILRTRLGENRDEELQKLAFMPLPKALVKAKEKLMFAPIIVFMIFIINIKKLKTSLNQKIKPENMNSEERTYG